MKKIKPLHYKLLRRKLDISQLTFANTKKLKPLNGFIGQKRALDALNFGVCIRKKGYNLFAMGPAGIGKHSLVTMVLKEHAAKRPVPPDWCYIYNFNLPESPIALQLPAGKGTELQKDMNQLIAECGQVIVSVFESDEYLHGIKRINEYFKIKRARKRKRKTKSSSEKIPYMYQERHEKEKRLALRLLTSMIDPIINKIKKKYKKYAKVLIYLDHVKKHLIEHANDYIVEDSKTKLLDFPLDNQELVKYKVNVIVDNSKTKGAPILFEETPYYSNLICRVEYTTRQGALVTNFDLIRSGSLHRANGGYLIIEARKLVKNRDAWEALKSAIYSQQIKIEPIGQASHSIKTISLAPESIPIQVKIILIGDRNTYYSLCNEDHDFVKLFKVPVDFDEHIARNEKNITLYSRLIGTITQEEKLRPFASAAVGEIIDQSTRICEDNDKLSTYFRFIKDLAIEADYWAERNKKRVVSANEVKQAIKAQTQRMDRTRQLYYEDIQRDFIIIDTVGKTIGQVNCLSVRRVGNFSYGHPTRVTARVRAGKGDFVDIQREIKLAGPMHSKAGLIITNLLASKFNPQQLFSLSASLSFEQLYCWTDGDSASVGELCALLSALAEIPVNQHLAITGSIDQFGEVQAIGGVNEKIEGFFDVCKARGLNGKQGVIIPAVNAKNLMLREDVVQAAREKKFMIYLVTTLDEAVTLLTDVPAGKRKADGSYQRDSLYAKVAKRLEQFNKNRMMGKK